MDYTISGFLMNICHVICLVQDWFVDIDQMEFVKMAEALKPSAPALSSYEDNSPSVEYYPGLIYVHNKASAGDFSLSSMREKQEHLKEIMEPTSQLHFSSGITTGGDVFNLSIIPEIDTDSADNSIISVTALDEASMQLRQAVNKVVPRPLSTNVKMTELGWLQHAQKTWDQVKNSSFYMEYNRLLQ